LATRIRLKRFGGRHDPHYRIVVADSRKQRDGRAIEELGYYSPVGNPPVLEVNGERALHWLSVGAQPSDTVRSLLRRAGVITESVGEAPEEIQAAPEAAEAETEIGAEDVEAVEDAEEAEAAAAEETR